jgi:hypothetical protein
MGIGLDQLRPSTKPFHGIAPGKQVQPLGQIDLPVWFGTLKNFRKEILTFEVVGFKGAYHAILGRPCYTKFVIDQVMKNASCHDDKMEAYCKAVRALEDKFYGIELNHTPPVQRGGRRTGKDRVRADHRSPERFRA